MMIRRLLSVQRIGLKLSILSLFIFPLILNSEDKDEGLELPEVYIYGTYLGRMQFSPKKDFYPYINQGDLFPPSRPISPEFHVTAQRLLPGEREKINHYWLLLDAGAGNWWSDKVFLDCGLRNETGLLSLRFTDFRRKGWAEDHCVNDDFVRIKGVLNQEDYYISGDGYYNYEKVVKGVNSQYDTVSTNGGGVGLLMRFEFDPVKVSLSGDFSLNSFIVLPQEKIFKNLINFGVPLRNYDISGNINIEGARFKVNSESATKSITSLDVLLKKTINKILAVSPGIRIFIDESKISVAPLISINAMIENFELYPFVSYFERKMINTVKDIYERCPFVVGMNEYKVLEEKNITGGFEGKWQKTTCFVAYSHIEYDNYPMLLATFIEGFSFQRTRKDVLKTDIGLDFSDFTFEFTGNYTLREKIPYEPVSEFNFGMTYKGFSPVTLFGNVNSSFAIETLDDEVDIFTLNAGVEYQLLKDFSLRFETENIMDQRYEIWEGYIEGGVQFYASLKYKIIK